MKAILRKLLNDGTGQIPLLASPASVRIRSLKSAHMLIAGRSLSVITAAPALHLRHLIQGFWEVRGDFHEAHDYILPTSDIAVVVNLGPPQRLSETTGRERSLRDAWIAGPRTKPLTCIGSHGTWVCGLRLTIQGAYLALHTVPRELLNQVADLASIKGQMTSSLVNNIRDAPDAERRFAILAETIENWSSEGASWNGNISQMIAMFRATGGLARIASLSADIGFSRQYLSRSFVDHVGMSPKAFARLIRFQRATRLIGSRKHADLSSIALDCGYFDQAHFTRDFREFSGFAPAEFSQFATPRHKRGFVAPTRHETSEPGWHGSGN